jgi:diguanylate cyclase
MADLDHFKHVNDAHGHDVGDQVLQEVGARLRASVRTEDQVARWGGEEFLVLLPGADQDTAWRVAEKIRGRVAEMHFATNAGNLPVSISVGASVSEGQASFDPVVQLADQALYQAKNAGRNRTVLAGAARPGSQATVRPQAG